MKEFWRSPNNHRLLLISISSEENGPVSLADELFVPQNEYNCGKSTLVYPKIFK